MNWQGFEQVERRNYVPPSEPNKVYVQYKWSSKIIAAEKYRLAAQAEDSLGKSSKNTIEASSGSDSSHLTDQTSNTNLESDPIKQLASLKKESERLGLEFRQIVSNLICGMTINQLAKLYREYDRFELRSLELKNGYVQYFAFFWGEYSVRIYDPYILKNRPPERLSYSNSELFISGAREVPIVYVYDQFDRGNLIAKVCPKF
jgi:hypothetical protein